MKFYFFSLLIITLLSFSSCELVDKAKTQYDRYKNIYEETVDTIKRGEKPFDDEDYQGEEPKEKIILSTCTSNEDVKHIYFSTQSDASNNIFNAIKNLYSYPNNNILKPFWDIRYTNPVSTYIHHNDGTHYANHAKRTSIDTRTGIRNIVTGTVASQTDASGSVVQSKCINNTLAAGVTINLNDAPEQSLNYSGIVGTFIYQIHTNNHIRPWKVNTFGNLMIQASFDKPVYQNFSSNIGGSVSFNVFLYNPKIKKHINYIIAIYAFGEAWIREKAGIRFDPTTNIIHVATVIKKSSWWSTIGQGSKSIREIKSTSTINNKDDGKWDEFYQTNISYQNLLAALNELKNNPPEAVAGQNFGLNPEDWEVTFMAIQYELEEQGGKALLSGSFKGFEAYISNKPI